MCTWILQYWKIKYIVSGRFAPRLYCNSWLRFWLYIYVERKGSVWCGYSVNFSGYRYQKGENRRKDGSHYNYCWTGKRASRFCYLFQRLGLWYRLTRTFELLLESNERTKHKYLILHGYWDIKDRKIGNISVVCSVASITRCRKLNSFGQYEFECDYFEGFKISKG